MQRWIFRFQRTKGKQEHREEKSWIHRKCVEHRKKLSATPGSQFPYRKSERLRHRRGNNSFYPIEPQEWEAKNCKRWSRREFSESRIQFPGGIKNCIPKIFGWSETVTAENFSSKKPRGVAPRRILSVFNQTHRMIRLTICRREKCYTRGVKEASGRRTALWTSWLDESASRELHVLVGRDSKRHRRKMQYMHSLYELR